MAQNEDSDNLRSAAELLITNTRTYRGSNMPTTSFDITRAHSINLITEEFLAGYMQDGRMSVVRRFFCLFVTFDLFFVSLLWLICIMITGDNIYQAFQKQIVNYTVYTSLFDVVFASICRFLVLLLFYALLYINHWFIIAFSTTSSCFFLISKVFLFDWVDSKQQVFQVILIIVSFVLSWGEAWFLDCRVFPQERHARRYFSAMTSSDRSSLITAPFLAATQNERRPPESVLNFYSPLDTVHNSDDEAEEDEDYRQMGLDCIRKAYELFESTEWKVEKVTSKGDTIQSTQRNQLGKIYKLTGRIKYPAKALLDELFYKIEEVPKWNPTLLESKIVRKINSYTDITYQASVSSGGGIIKSRDFVNLRCWRLLRKGIICEDNVESDDDTDDENPSCEGSVTTISDTGESQAGSVESRTMKMSRSTTNGSEFPNETITTVNPFSTLSKSLGAKDFSTAVGVIDFEEPPPIDELYEDAKMDLVTSKPTTSRQQQTSAADGTTTYGTTKEKVWISAAISVDYAKVPPTSKYTRGENLISGFALREIKGKTDSCIFEWILCLDLKGYIPRYVLDTAYTTFMSDYMTYLRKYVNELRLKRKNLVA